MVDSKNGLGNSSENADKPKAIQPEEAISNVVRDFVESKFRQAKVEEFYVSMAGKTFDEQKLRGELASFLAAQESPEYQSLAKNKEFAKFLSENPGVTEKLRSETLIKGRKIGNLHASVLAEIDAAYDIPSEMAKKLRETVRSQSVLSLQHALRSRNYEGLVSEAFWKATPAMRRSQVLEIEEHFDIGGDSERFSNDEKLALWNALRYGNLDRETLQPILKRLTIEGRKKLLEILEPTVSIGKLLDLDILTYEQAKKVVRKNLVNEKFLPGDEGVHEEIADTVEKYLTRDELSEFRIATKSLGKHGNTYVWKMEFSDMIAERINMLGREYEASLTSQEIPEGTDAKTLVEEILPKILHGKADNIGLLSAKEHLEGDKPVYAIVQGHDAEGKAFEAYLRIGTWYENLANPKKRKKKVDVTVLGNPEATLSPSTLSRGESRTYGQFAYDLETSDHVEFLDAETMRERIKDVPRISEEHDLGTTGFVQETPSAEADGHKKAAEPETALGWDAEESVNDQAARALENADATAGGGGSGQPPENGGSAVSEEEPEDGESSRPPSEGAPETGTGNAELAEAVAESSEGTLAWLKEKLDEIDPEGRNVNIEPGSYFMTGKPGSGNSFGIFKITRTEDRTGSQPGHISIDDDLGGQYTLTIENFFSSFKGESLAGPASKRITKVSNRDGFLQMLKMAFPEKASFDNIEIDADNNRLSDPAKAESGKYSGARFFIGPAGEAVEIIELRGDYAKVNFWTDVNEGTTSDGKPEFKGTSVYSNKTISYQALSTLFGRYGLKLSEAHGDEETIVQEREVTEHTEHGHLKHWFSLASLSDLMNGGKHFIEFIKEKIAHGNHLQEARVMMMLGRTLGMEKWNGDWFLDLKAKVENNEKKLVEERLEELGKMAGPDRQQSVYESLMNDGSHDYEHWASALSMLEKHGTLYVGAKLRRLEGTYIFYKRIRGLPLSASLKDDPYFKSAKESLEKNREPVTEEGIIREFLKKAGGERKVNSLMWVMLRKKWEEGMSNEREAGKKEAEGFMTLSRRVSNALDKFRENEYSKGIGAALAISGKPGSAADKHTPWFVLAISRTPERFNQDILQSFTKYYDEGRTHSPALMFLKDPTSQDKFRKTVETLCAVNDRRNPALDMTRRFQKMMETVNSGNKFADDEKTSSIIHAEIERFWKDYGKILQPQLTLSPMDPTIAYEMENYDIFRSYAEKLKDEMGNTNYDGTELDLGTYFRNDREGASMIYAKPDKVLGKIKVNPNGVTLHQGDKLSEVFMGHFMETIRDIKKIQSTPEEARTLGVDLNELTLRKQKSAYKRLHKEFYKFAIREFGQNYEKFWEGEKKDWNRKKYAAPLEGLKEFGFNSRGIDESVNSLEDLERAAYDEQLDADFAHFLWHRQPVSSAETARNAQEGVANALAADRTPSA